MIPNRKIRTETAHNQQQKEHQQNKQGGKFMQENEKKENHNQVKKNPILEINTSMSSKIQMKKMGKSSPFKTIQKDKKQINKNGTNINLSQKRLTKQSPKKSIQNKKSPAIKYKTQGQNNIQKNFRQKNLPAKQGKTNNQVNKEKKSEQIQSQEIKLMIQNFNKIVAKPVQFIENLQNSNTLQRCQVHNSIFTLYCTIDRKPLCVGCMYQTTDHKQHRVLPLNKAYQSLRQDSEAYLNKAESIVKGTQQLIKRTNQNIITVQRQYPSIVYKIQYFYTTFHQMLRQKEKQQIQRLKSLKQAWKKQFYDLSLQLHRINYFMTDKLNFQYKQIKDEYLLTKRCILQTLCKTGKVVKQDMVIYEKGKFDTQLSNLDLVKDLIDYRLTLVTPVFPNSFINKRKSLFKNQQYQEPQSPLKIQPASKKHESKVSVKKQFSVQKKNVKGIMRGFVPLSPVAKLHRTVSFN